MKAKEGLKLVFGSVVVYVVMAACASSGPGSAGGSGSGSVAAGGGDRSAGSRDGSDSSAGGSSSGGTALNDSGGKGILDALTDPIAEASAAPTSQSGSRLKAKYYVGSDGSRQFAGWHDSMLNVDCTFLLATDGTTRCMPVAAVTIAFSDPGCAVPLGLLYPKGCAPGPYVSQAVAATACAAYTSRVFQVGAAYAGPLYTGSPASCTAQPDAGAASLRSTYDIYSLGSEVAPSTFVAATVQTDP